MKRAIAMWLMATMTSCGPQDECVPSDTRCNGSRVEVCDADGEWELAQDCRSIPGDFSCCWVPADELGPAGHACLAACPEQHTENQ